MEARAEAVVVDGSMLFDCSPEVAVANAAHIAKAVAVKADVDDPGRVRVGVEDFGDGARVRYSLTVPSAVAGAVAASLGALTPAEMDLSLIHI